MRAALIDKETGIVRNVIEYDPASNYEPEEQFDILILDDASSVSPGWTNTDGVFNPPPVKRLETTASEIQLGNSSVAEVKYTNTFDDAPLDVTFSVNGATATVALEAGEAALEVEALYPGDILIACDGLELTITAVEVG